MSFSKKLRFAVIGDCHFSYAGNYATRDCRGAKKQLEKIIKILNKEKLNFVLSLGDIGNGDSFDEIPKMLEVYKTSLNPVKYVIGNHDLVLRTADEVALLLGMPSSFYDFDFEDYKFIILNAFEQSRYCPPGSKERLFYDEFVKNNAWLKIQPWPGLMTEDSWKKLKVILDGAEAEGKNVILFSHVPTYKFGGNDVARIPDFRRMLALLDNYSNIRAYISGHCHQGGLFVRNGVMHKTVRSVCDNREPTACIFEADEEKLSVYGIGAEDNFCSYFKVNEAEISGTAPAGCYVMTNCGTITKVADDGNFSLKVPCPGMYCLKAVMDKCDDVYIPWIKAPIDGLRISFKQNQKRKLYSGRTNGYSLLRIKDGTMPIRWFDVAGNQFGSIVPDRKMWCEHSENYWSDGTYAFTAENEVSIRALPLHRMLRDVGWYKGDLHAHLIHGEGLYIGNVQESVFIAKSEGYDWLYFAEHHGNDGYPTDADTLVRKLSQPNFLYRINEEFPKSRSNHFGNCGIGPVMESVDTKKISSLELAEKFVWSQGGITIPVHPFFGHMSFRELCLWLLCAPEKMPCMDFFYNDDFPREMAESYWFMLLNRGYEIGCFATSDAAFDVGRTPGSDRGATYLHMEYLSEDCIKEAILKRRTMVSWDCAAILFSVGNYISGDIIKADGNEYTLCTKVLWQKDRRGILRIIRCGEDIERVPIRFLDDDEVFEYSIKVSETENCWYLAIVESEDAKIRSAVSPVWFRNSNFVAPEVINFTEPFPAELLAECEKLTPEQLVRPELIDEFAIKLKKLIGK